MSFSQYIWSLQPYLCKCLPEGCVCFILILERLPCLPKRDQSGCSTSYFSDWIPSSAQLSHQMGLPGNGARPQTLLMPKSSQVFFHKTISSSKLTQALKIRLVAGLEHLDDFSRNSFQNPKNHRLRDFSERFLFQPPTRCLNIMSLCLQFTY